MEPTVTGKFIFQGGIEKLKLGCAGEVTSQDLWVAAPPAALCLLLHQAEMLNRPNG